MTKLPIFQDVTVYDELEPCPYLDGEIARLPLQVPCQRVDPNEIDERLAQGQRRTGEFVYLTHCPNCDACEPIRLCVDDVEFSKTQQRTLRKNNDILTPYIGPVLVDNQRVALFNAHRNDRQLGRNESRIEIDEYAWAFQRSCFDTFEISYQYQGQLACVAICDQGKNSVSAVYTYYHPQFSKLSLGTYSILKQIEYCRQTSREFLYLGFYIQQCRPMNYKSRFVPHQRLVGSRWQEFQGN